MVIKYDYNNFLIMDGEKLLSISHHFFPVFTFKNNVVSPSRALWEETHVTATRTVHLH